MKINRCSIVLVFLAIVIVNCFLFEAIQERAAQVFCFPYETALGNLRSHQISEETLDAFLTASEGEPEVFYGYLTMYFGNGGTVTDLARLEEEIQAAEKYQAADFAEIKDYVRAIWSSLLRFPVGKINGEDVPQVAFADSWMQSRTYGGERGHEGTDLMADVDQPGIYPVYSISDGTVENIGWLRLGGWRIGIRSDSGAYFYYAHLAEYADAFQVGDSVQAGTFLGFMGNTGYGEEPGTAGKFPVHLHLGIYLDDKSGVEFSVNSYPMLRYLWEAEHGNKTGQIPF